MCICIVIAAVSFETLVIPEPNSGIAEPPQSVNDAKVPWLIGFFDVVQVIAFVAQEEVDAPRSLFLW